MAKRNDVQQTGPMDAEEWSHLKKPAQKAPRAKAQAPTPPPLWKSSVERLVQAKKTQDRVRSAIADTEERLRTLRKELNDADALSKQALEELR